MKHDGDDPDDDPIRARILARRRRFLAAALAGVIAPACEDPAPTTSETFEGSSEREATGPSVAPSSATPSETEEPSAEAPPAGDPETSAVAPEPSPSASATPPEPSATAAKPRQVNPKRPATPKKVIPPLDQPCLWPNDL